MKINRFFTPTATYIGTYLQKQSIDSYTARMGVKKPEEQSKNGGLACRG